MVGDYNSNPWLNPSNPAALIMSANNTNNWTFALTQFAFGYENTTTNVSTMSYVNLTTDNYNQAFMTLSHPGIALPTPLYSVFYQML